MDKVGLLGLLLASLLLLGSDATAAATPADVGGYYAAQLSGGEEVPPRTSPASGQAAFQVSADGMSMTYSVTVTNIQNIIAGHIHIAPKGVNGDIVMPLVPTAQPGGGPKNGIIGQGTVTADQLIGPFQGKSLRDLIAQMDAGNAYVNIHTATGASPASLVPGDFPPGEIRGQIVAAPMPVLPAAGGGYGQGRAAPRPWGVLVAILPLAGAAYRWRRHRRA